MDIIEASRALNIKDNVYILGEGFGSTLAYLTLKQAPDYFSGALLINFKSSLGVDANVGLDIKDHLNKLCNRDQECQSLVYEVERRYFLAMKTQMNIEHCGHSVESVIDRILPSSKIDQRGHLRKAALLLGRAFPNQPQNILMMHVFVKVCPNIKRLSRFFNAAYPKIPGNHLDEQLRWLNEKTRHSPRHQDSQSKSSCNLNNSLQDNCVMKMLIFILTTSFLNVIA